MLLVCACSANTCGVGIYRHEVIGEPSPAQLIAALKAEDAETRAVAARSLGILGPKADSAIPALKEALEDPDARVRSEAAAALEMVEAGR
jgi:HEAT repeat protein